MSSSSETQSPHQLSNLIQPKFWLGWLGIGFLWLVALLPFPLIYGLSAVLGELFFWLVASRRHITETNLKLCFPELSDSQVRQIARRHFRLLVCSFLSIGVVWWGSKKRLQRLIKVVGRERLDQALDNGDNVILLAPHFVGLDAGGMILSKDMPVLSMYQRNPNDLFDHMAVIGRTRFNALIYDRRAPLTGLIRHIRKQRPFYYLPDQNAGPEHGIFVPFFGVQASTFPTLGKIAVTGKAIVLPVYTEILPWGRGIRSHIRAPLENYPTGDTLADTTLMNQAVEIGAAEFKADYLWSHKRFKRRPDGEPDLYKR